MSDDDKACRDFERQMQQHGKPGEMEYFKQELRRSIIWFRYKHGGERPLTEADFERMIAALDYRRPEEIMVERAFSTVH